MNNEDKFFVLLDRAINPASSSVRSSDQDGIDSDKPTAKDASAKTQKKTTGQTH